MSQNPSNAALSAIEKQFRKCSPETLQAIHQFRQAPDPCLIPQIVHGVMRKYLSVEAVDKLAQLDLQTTLSSLGVDSLTMLEIILDV